ncbi:hypothetical protein [Cerasicoccus fimbriatus]|uniref:hypothetical protein n=1 Tax=Cerasicoccus fimbriatus TaxID=3014554 RepID=UPI0022B3D787|nr:hypothetical protein [Cerasicoccus sp. TK19100]
MNSFYGITLGVLAGSLFLSGCKGVNNWFEREHELMPLKEQYFNGELSWNEYREKKELLLEDLERREYHEKLKDKREAERMANDTHTVNHMVEEKTEKEVNDAVLAEDNAIIYEKPEPVVSPEPESQSADAIDMGLLSRSIKTKDTPKTGRDTGIVLTSEPTVAPGEELITDSKDVKWTKGKDGVVTYEDPKGAEMVEQIIQRAESPQPPAQVQTTPVDQALQEKAKQAPNPEETAKQVQEKVEEAKEDPAKAEEEEPVIMDFGTIE